MATTDVISNKELAREFAARLWSGRLDEARSMLADDCILHDPMAPGDGFDVDGFIARFEEMQEALTDPEYHVEDIVAEGDYVFFRGWMACTHTGEFMGIAPTNERIRGEDHIELRFEDGKIAEAWAQYDTLGMLAQVGVDVPKLA